MLNSVRTKYSYNDVMIVPATISNIEHRSECNPFIDNKGSLPIFASPMSNVVDTDNYEKFIFNGITPILPRNYDIRTRIEYAYKGLWAAFSLREFEDYFANGEKVLVMESNSAPVRALIDVANGHMKKIIDLIKLSKGLWGDNIQIMAGNIANPHTYREYAKAGAWGIRCSVGTGACCISSTQTGIHFPIASLISEIADEKRELKGHGVKNLPHIIADGGIRNYSDVIKALALGADYVMIGSLFASMLESAADKYFVEKFYGVKPELEERNFYYGDDIAVKDSETTWEVRQSPNYRPIPNCKIYAKYYGMASRKGQIDFQGEKTKTSEGNEKDLLVTTTLEKWTDNMVSYLKSAMSYTNSRSLKDFKKNAEVIVISENTKNSINQ